MRPRLLACLLVLPLVAGCAAEDAPAPGAPVTGDPPASPAPAPTRSEERAPAAPPGLAEFQGQRLQAWLLAGQMPGRAAEPVGVRLTTLPGGALELSIETQDEGMIAGPYTLLPDAAAPTTRFGAEVADFLGAAARLRVELPTEPGVEPSILAAPLAPRDVALATPTLRLAPHATLPQGADSDDLRTRREAFIRHYLDVLKNDVGLTSVERFACIVQIVVDANVKRVENGSLDDDDLREAIIEDLADIMLPTDYQALREWFMHGHALDGKGALLPIHEGLPTGFNENLARGEGRFRHFIANALVADESPDLVTNLVARAGVGDWEWNNDREGDTLADLETNALGREFVSLLQELIDNGTVSDGGSVKEWMIDKFGNHAPDVDEIKVTYSTHNGEPWVDVEVKGSDPDDNVQNLNLSVQIGGPSDGCSVFPHGNGGLAPLDGCNETELENATLSIRLRDARGGWTLVTMPLPRTSTTLTPADIDRLGHTVEEPLTPHGNAPAVIVLFTNRFVPAAHSNFYEARAVDPDGGAVTISWQFQGACGVTQADGGSFSWNHEGCDWPEESATFVVVTATDARGDTAVYRHAGRAQEDGTPIRTPADQTLSSS